MNSLYRDQIQINEIRFEDVPRVAALHRRIFPDYFLAHMGQAFLERFYGEFVNQSNNYGVVARSNEATLGFVVGTADSSSLYRRFYRRHFLSLAGIAAWRFIRDPYIRQNVAARIPHLRLAVASLLRRSPKTDGLAPDTPTARLLSIGIDAAARGRGISEALLDRFLGLLREDGITEVGLSVRAENARAIGFYLKTGWREELAAGSTIRYRRSTHPLTDRGDRQDA